LSSYLVAMTIVPLFCARFIRRKHPAPDLDGAAHGIAVGAGSDADSDTDSDADTDTDVGVEHARPKSAHDIFNSAFHKLLFAYDSILSIVLRKPVVIVLSSLAIFTASLLIYPHLGVSFFPRTDAGQFVINLKAPSGTNLLVTEKELAKVEKIVREVVAPEDYGMMVTNIGVVPDFSAIYTSNSAPNTAFLQVSLTDGHKVGSYEYMDRVRGRLRREMPHMSAYFQSGGFVDAVLNFGMPAPIDVQVSGPSLELAHGTATELAAQMRGLPGVKDILIPQDIDSPALRIDFDRLRADQLGLNTKELITNLITALSSNQTIAPTYWTDPKSNNDYFLTVQYPESQVKTFDDLRAIPLHAPGNPRRTSLDAVSNLKMVQAPTEVAHYALRKVVDTYVSLASEDLGHTAKQIEDIVAATKLPKGVRVDMRGMVAGMRASFLSFGMGPGLALVLLYLILVAQFRSFVDPLLILLAVPMGLVGVLVMLYTTGTTINVQSLMGIAMMVGIVVSNSILIVEFARRMREDGMPVREAVATAGRVRLRPILMTSLATIIGLLPMAIKLGTGSEAYAPLARAIIGGMSMSLVMTVFIVPAAYLMVYRNREAI